MADHHLALQQIGLLEQLALRCGCLFVTQLRGVSPYRLRCALDSIDPDRYSLWEWNEATPSFPPGAAPVTGSRQNFLI